MAQLYRPQPSERVIATARSAYQPPTIRPLSYARWRKWVSLTAAVDLIALMSALTLSTATRFGGDAIRSDPTYGRKLWMWLGLWWVSLILAGVYERHRVATLPDELRSVVHGVTVGEVVAIAGAFFVGFRLSRLWALLVWMLGVIFVLLGRACTRAALGWLRRRGRLRRRALIVGTDNDARELASAAESANGEGIDVVGFIALEPGAGCVEPIGELADLRSVVLAMNATEVIVSPAATTSEIDAVVSALDGVPVELRVSPGLDGFLVSRLALQPLGHRALVAIARPELRPSARAIKRLFDVFLATVLALLALPVVFVCSVAIVIDSGRPVFFKQRRVGAGGEEFVVWKLRSMVQHAEALRDSVRRSSDADGLLFKMRADPRVTRVGRVLRRTSLDELPQLWNVLRGDMSLVGPRPPLPEEVANYDAPLRRRLLVKPGITGLWQVSGRNELSFDDYVRFDLLYVQSWSLALDLYILLRTVPTVISRRGAY